MKMAKSYPPLSEPEALPGRRPPGERGSIGIIYLENKQVPINKCRGASLGAPQKGGHRGPPLRINKSIFMVVGDP